MEQKAGVSTHRTEIRILRGCESCFWVKGEKGLARASVQNRLWLSQAGSLKTLWVLYFLIPCISSSLSSVLTFVSSSSFPTPLSPSKSPSGPCWILRNFVTSPPSLSFSNLEPAHCGTFSPPVIPSPPLGLPHHRTVQSASASQAKYMSIYFQWEHSAHPRTGLWLCKVSSHQTPSDLRALSSPDQLQTTAEASWSPEVLSSNPASPFSHITSGRCSQIMFLAKQNHTDSPCPSWPSSRPVLSAGSLLTFLMMMYFQFCLLKENDN